MKHIQLAVFDMAGTTVNEDNVVYKTVQKAINRAGYETLLEFVLEHGAGKEKHQAIKDILAQLKLQGIDKQVPSQQIFEDFKVLLDEAYETLNVTSYEGLEELLPFLKENGVKVALNTGYNSRIANILLDKMGWKLGQQYDTLVTADDVSNGRPAPDMIHTAMERLGVSDPETTLKAGDSAIDIHEGKNAKCGITIGVTTGAQTREQLAEADPTYIMDSLTELKQVLFG